MTELPRRHLFSCRYGYAPCQCPPDPPSLVAGTIARGIQESAAAFYRAELARLVAVAPLDEEQRP